MPTVCVCVSRLACDLKVVKLLREKTVGHSAIDLLRFLSEQHAQAWMSRCLRYLSVCHSFNPTGSPPPPHQQVLPPPPMTPLPSITWLRAFLKGQDAQVHLAGVVNHLSEKLFKRKLTDDAASAKSSGMLTPPPAR